MANLVDRILNPRKPGQEGPVGRLINNPFVMSLLAQQGFSTMPTSPLQAVGRAGLQAQQIEQQRAMSALQEQLMRSQIGLNEAKAKLGPNPSGRNVQSQFITQDGKLGFLRRDGSREITDISVKDSFSFQTLPDGSQVAVSKTQPGVQVPVITADEASKATVRKATNEEAAETAAALPDLEQRTATALEGINALRTHSGLPGAVGAKGPSSVFGLLDTPLGGTEAAGFRARAEQIAGEAFLRAFQDLKGGGHITEIEGQKAEQAITRIRNFEQPESDYLQALDELERILTLGMERAKRKAGGDFSVSEGPPKSTEQDQSAQRLRYNPTTRRLEPVE